MYTLNIHTEETLQAKIDNINEWIDNHYPSHYLWRQKKQALNYYTTKLGVLTHNQAAYIHA